MRLPKPAKRSPKPRVRVRRKRKGRIMPRCKHCAHGYRRHILSLVTGRPVQYPDGGYACNDCVHCLGYEPARGLRQQRRTPVAALRKAANDLWSKIVRARPGGCECPREDHGAPIYQGCHGFGKKAYPAVRYLLINGWKMTNTCHRYYTGHPIEWDNVMRKDLGRLAYEELRYLALKNDKQDMPAVLAKLREEASRLGIK